LAQITNVTSESLQATVRRLLPSQQGFGEDLQASNVITPIIDLTATAEGSILREDLQTALAFGSNTDFTVNNSNDLIISTAGFFRVFGVVSARQSSTTDVNAYFIINDGTTANVVYRVINEQSSTGTNAVVPFDFVVFLRSNDVFRISSDNTVVWITGSTRQVADVNGNLVNPSGFTFE
tara:strand:- start:525 stop:1061 length:537 start_codon:yes stop_codon:yes gene_type:complete